MQYELLTTDPLNVEREQCDRFEDQVTMLETLTYYPDSNGMFQIVRLKTHWKNSEVIIFIFRP